MMLLVMFMNPRVIREWMVPKNPKNKQKAFSAAAAATAQELPVPNLLAMVSKMRREELAKAIQEYGETPPKSWTVAELRTRLAQLHDEHSVVPGKPAQTDLRKWVIKLNVASKKKATLQEFCLGLKIPLTMNETIAQLQKVAMTRIYEISHPDPTDPVGFGKASSLSYEEVKLDVNYCAWVLKTLGGGWHVPPTGPTGKVAAVGTERNHTRTNRCQDEQQGAQLEPPDPECDRHERDGCPEHEQPRQQSSSHGCHGSDHEHDEGTEGGDCRPSRTAATQESGEFRRELQRGEWPERIAERQSESQSAAVSSSLEGRSSLSEKHAKQIELQSMAALPKTFQSLVTGDRKTVLLEVACSPESVLSRVTQETVGYEEAAIRCSHWNNHDLSTGEGVKLVLSQIDRLRPAHVWISTECGPYSPMQNLNQKDEHQRQQLEEKRKAVLKQYVGASCILHYAIQRGCHVTWEWSEKCQAWRLPLIQKIMSRYQMWVSVVHGCQVNLRDPKTKHHLHKGWKLMTTHKRLFTDDGFAMQVLQRHQTCEM